MSLIGCISDTAAEARFEWEIPKCFSLPSLPLSPEFSFLGCTWQLRLYPVNNTVSWMKLSLLLNYPANSYKNVTFTFGVKKSDGTLEEKESRRYTFTKEKPEVKESRFLFKDDFYQRRSQLAPSDVLTITCHIKNGVPYPDILAKPRPLNRKEPDSSLTELESLSTNFKDLFTSKSNSDVVIGVKDVEFRAHKLVLTVRSPVFAAMFEHCMSEKETGTVTVPDCDPDTFGNFLEYLYSGKIGSVSFENAYHLYVTAHKYQVKELESFCVAYMRQNLTVENLFDVVNLAELYGETGLMHAVQNFFNLNASKIISTAEWETLMKQNFDLGNNLLKELLSKVKLED